MTTRSAKIVTILIVLICSACSSTITTRVTTFLDDSTAPKSGTIRVLPLDKQYLGSQEFAYYAKPLKAKLRALGFEVVDEPSSDYLAELGFEVTRREAEDRNNNAIIVSSGFGSFYRRSGFGIVIDVDNDKIFEYQRNIAVRLSRRVTQDDAGRESKDAKNSLVEVNAVSTGKCDLLPPVYDTMLDAIFSDFYRRNGSTVRVKAKLASGYCKLP